MDYFEQLNEALKTIEDLKAVNKSLSTEVLNLKIQNQNLKKMIFGAKREKTPVSEEIVDGNQASLFEEVSTEGEMDKKVDKEIEEVTEQTITYTRKTKNRRGGIRRSFLDNIEFVKEEFVVEDGTTCIRSMKTRLALPFIT